MDWSAIIAEAGGGLSGLIIAGLAFVAWAERRRGIQLTDRMFKREQQHSAQLVETLKAVETVANTIRDRRND